MSKDDPSETEPPYIYECTDCGERVETESQPTECPNCGAEMQNISKPREK